MKHTLTLISLLINLLMAGFTTQFGMLIEPLSHAFSAQHTDIAPLFSVITGGALAGTIFSFFFLERIGHKPMLLANCLVIAVSTVVMSYTDSIAVLASSLAAIGFFGGVGLCIAGATVSRIWQGPKQRTVLVLQDLTFNLSGVIFPIITTYALTTGLIWSSSYLVVGAVAVATGILTLLTPFEQNKQQLLAAQNAPMSLGVAVAACCMLVGLGALYIFLTWAPMYLNDKFAIGFEQAGTIITQYWSAALFGGFFASMIISRFTIASYVIGNMAITAIITALIVNSNSLEMIQYLTFAFGFICAAIYNAFIAYGMNYAPVISSKYVSLIMICGSSGAMLSPLISSKLVEPLGLPVLMQAIPYLFAAVVLILLSHQIYLRQSSAR
ncbi:MFS transporter TsgA [Paraferrimonas sp. SM1919]|uniref:MFS transporter TsgA n=1 Tax=Paraferrimonas sp. SM1919 TaxID=2662263 RepID=UPI0013D44A39|nr:MFS transporter TsgA [Paraferrimonas sp. SM1919]